VAGTGITSALGDFCYETTTVILPGFLADRLGHVPVLVAGYVLGGVLTAALTACAFLFHVESVALLTVIFFIAGLYVAVQEALESTVTAEMVDKDILAMSIGALGTINGTAKRPIFLIQPMIYPASRNGRALSAISSGRVKVAMSPSMSSNPV